jgi:uncharacterized protein (UPF0261 family)
MKTPSKTVALLGTLDTKSIEIDFLDRKCKQLGLSTLIINVGLLDTQGCHADITAVQVLAAAGLTEKDLAHKTINEAIGVMTGAAEILVPKLYREGRLSGVIGIGGGRGSHLCATAMRALPFGVPKLLVSTVAGRTSAPFVDTSDLVIFPSVSDIVGINRITATVLSNAAAAMFGMVTSLTYSAPKGPLVAITALGVTTESAAQCMKFLNDQGYEAAVFHCNGLGGRVMERQIRDGLIEGVLDLTITELANEMLGGTGTAGANRLEAAGELGIPQVVAPGGLDMALFQAVDRLPAKYTNRLTYKHNPTTILMRTTPDENLELGKIVGRKLLKARGAVFVLIPRKGVSAYDQPKGVFYLPDGVAAFERGLRDVVGHAFPIEALDVHINEECFARRAVSVLVAQLKLKKEGAPK